MTEEKFGISPEDQAILDRLKSNRDAKHKDTDTDNGFHPIIKFAESISNEEMKAKRNESSRMYQRMRKEKNAMAKERSSLKDNIDTNIQKDIPISMDSVPLVKTSSNKKSHIRGTTIPEISYDPDKNMLLTWKRHYIRKSQVLILPKAIELDGILLLVYNPQSKELVIRALPDGL